MTTNSRAMDDFDITVRCTDEGCAAHPGLHEPFTSASGDWYVEHVSNFGPSPKRWRQPVAAPAIACIQCRGTYDVHGVKQLGAVVNLCGYCAPASARVLR